MMVLGGELGHVASKRKAGNCETNTPRNLCSVAGLIYTLRQERTPLLLLECSRKMGMPAWVTGGYMRVSLLDSAPTAPMQTIAAHAARNSLIAFMAILPPHLELCSPVWNRAVEMPLKQRRFLPIHPTGFMTPQHKRAVVFNKQPGTGRLNDISIKRLGVIGWRCQPHRVQSLFPPRHRPCRHFAVSAREGIVLTKRAIICLQINALRIFDGAMARKGAVSCCFGRASTRMLPWATGGVSGRFSAQGHGLGRVAHSSALGGFWGLHAKRRPLGPPSHLPCLRYLVR